MFKSARWRSEKNKVKAVFKLQFHAAKVPQIGGDALMISVVPADVGKPTVKSDKALVRDGSCFWENPVYEIVKFSQEPKSGKIHERMYYFVVGTGSSKGGVLGEASIDFSNYAEATKVVLVALPLKNSKTEAVLNVSIQRMQESIDQREIEETENVKQTYKENSLKLQLENGDKDETAKNNSDDVQLNKIVSDFNPNRRASSGSDLTISSSEGSSGVEIPWQPQIKNDSDWLGNSALEGRSDDSDESSDIVIEKLKSEICALSRQAEMSELELQTLRKQIVKESKRGQDLFKELSFVKEERDSLKASKARTDSRFDGGECKAIVDELRQELNHAKEMNANLRVQLQKTQESNSELILAVKDLDEMLEQRNREILNLSSDRIENDDEEQRALEEIVKEHGDAKEAYILEQQIVEMHSEIEIYKRDRDELEMQIEQLALDYEIMKQENHEMAYKLEQSELQEKLKMQYECSLSYATTHELETQIEKLENELKTQSKEFSDALVKISELESHVKSLEEDIEKQSLGFEADIEAIMQSKVEQEQRAIRAEETLRKTRLQNANTAEKIQEEFRRLSSQMASTFEANEKLATKALADRNELRMQKLYLQEVIKKASEEHQSIKSSYEEKLCNFSTRIEKMQLEIDDKSLHLENQSKQSDETIKLLSEEILKLENEIETCMTKNRTLSRELEQMELLVEQGNEERVGLNNMITSLKNDAENSRKELNKMRGLVVEKELIIGSLQSEIDTFESQYTEIEHSLTEHELETEELRSQVFQLRDDLKKKEEALTSLEKKMKDGAGRETNPDAIKASSLKERIKSLEGQIKLKESTLQSSSDAFLEKEMDLLNRIEELEQRIQVLNRSNSQYKNEAEKDSNIRSIEEARNSDELALLKERNWLMEAELKEMQERYSEISLKFAEVEGERQQLVMKLRNLKNKKKNVA